MGVPPFQEPSGTHMESKSWSNPNPDLICPVDFMTQTQGLTIKDMFFLMILPLNEFEHNHHGTYKPGCFFGELR